MAERSFSVRQGGLYFGIFWGTFLPAIAVALSLAVDDDRDTRAARSIHEVALIFLVTTNLGLMLCLALFFCGLAYSRWLWQKMPQKVTVSGHAITLHRRSGIETFSASDISMSSKGLVLRDPRGRVASTLPSALLGKASFAEIRKLLP